MPTYNQFSDSGVVNGQIVYANHVKQFVDGFTAAEGYDIYVSGSFKMVEGTAIFAPGYQPTGGIIISDEYGYDGEPPLILYTSNDLETAHILADRQELRIRNGNREGGYGLIRMQVDQSGSQASDVFDVALFGSASLGTYLYHTGSLVFYTDSGSNGFGHVTPGFVSGSTAYFPGLPNTTTPNIVGFDTSTGALTYYSTASFGGGGGGTSGTSGVGSPGSSGTSGITGTSGTSNNGTSGTSGNGTSGISGTSGTSNNGTSGTSGAQGNPGSSGTSGTSIPGDPGSSGTSGIAGTSGTSGENGTSGTSGENGTSGTSGNGTSGTSGTGTSGTSGENGTSGTSGSSGTSGTSGTSGSSGTSGTSGTTGTSGTAGTSGTSQEHVTFPGTMSAGASGFNGDSMPDDSGLVPYGWLKIDIGGTLYYVPAWVEVAP